MLAYLYDNFLDDFDFFHISGDDTYLIVDNLKEFLNSPEIMFYEDVPGNLMFAGGYMFGEYSHEESGFYFGGGSGYTLSRKALKAFVELPLQDHNFGFKLRASDEDVRISNMFRIFLNTTGVDTRDASGAHRYHQNGIQLLLGFPPITRKHFTGLLKMAMDNSLLYKAFPIVYKEELVSSSSIAFHRMNSDEMRRYELILYGTGSDQCNNNVTTI